MIYMSRDLFENGELTISRKETHGKRRQLEREPIFTSRMEKHEYYKSVNFIEIRNVLDIKKYMEDIRANWSTYVSQVNRWIQQNPVRKMIVTGIFTIVLSFFTVTADAAFLQEYTYQVKNGDKIENIAKAHGVTAQEILDANGITSIEGKKILLPKVQDATVTATILNIRSQPNTGGRIIGQYKKGDIVKVSFNKNGWAGILINGQVCFVSADYLSQKQADSITRSQPSDIETTQDKTMYVTASSLRVRQGASTNSAVISSLQLNDSVSVISTSNGWAQINFNGKKAFVSAAYLTSSKIADQSQHTDISSASKWYVIKKGDTFTKVSKTFDISVSAIQKLNPTVDPLRLKIGQKIKIPDTAEFTTNKIIVTAQIGGVDPEGTFRFITSDGSTYNARATGNMINELFNFEGKKATLTFEGKRGQQMNLLSLR